METQGSQIKIVSNLSFEIQLPYRPFIHPSILSIYKLCQIIQIVKIEPPKIRLRTLQVSCSEWGGGGAVHHHEQRA